MNRMTDSLIERKDGGHTPALREQKDTTPAPREKKN